MGVIFALSAQPDLSSGLGTADIVLRKLAHLTEYGVLWALLAWAWRFERPLAAATLALLYAVSDELHQAFVEGRHAAPLDVLIDAVGIAIAMRARVVLTARRMGVRRP